MQKGWVGYLNILYSLSVFIIQGKQYPDDTMHLLRLWSAQPAGNLLSHEATEAAVLSNLKNWNKKNGGMGIWMKLEYPCGFHWSRRQCEDMMCLDGSHQIELNICSKDQPQEHA